jgi:SAM-dependent methyltransferase
MTTPSLPDEIARRLGAALLEATRLDPSAPLGRLDFVRVSSLEEYEAHCREAAALQRRRAELERLLAAPQEPFRCLGYDACVDQAAEFAVDLRYAGPPGADGFVLPNWRERLVSSRSGLNCRQRAVVLALKQVLGDRDPSSVSLYATEAVTPLFAFLRRHFPVAVGSELLGGAVPLGASRDGVRNEDVTRLTFEGASFDAVLCCDVLEHVPEHERALCELRRVLRPGGALLLTVPFRLDRGEHLLRARVLPSGEIEHLEPPERHGDPLSPEGGILCFRHFGWRLLDELRAAGFAEATALLVWSYEHGILGGDQLILHAQA